MTNLSPFLQRTLRNISWLTIDQFIRLGMNSLITILIARYYGKAAFGIYSVSLATIMIFSPLVTFGFDGYILRDLISNPDKRDEILGSTFIFRLFGGILAISCTLMTGDLLMRNQLARNLLYILSIGFFFQPFDILDLYFRSQLKAKYTVWSKTAAFLFIQAIKILALIFHFPLIAFAILFVLEIFIGAIGMMLVYQNVLRFHLVIWYATVKRIIYCLTEGWPLFLSSISTYIFTRIDQVLVAKMLGAEAVGEYSASMRLYELPIIIVGILSSSFFPLLHNQYNKSKTLFFRTYGIIAELYTLIAYAFIVLSFLFGDRVVLLFGKDFTHAGAILKVQVIGLAIWFNSGAKTTFLTLSSNQKLLFYSTVISAIVNISLNILLIPIYKAIGSAIAMIITNIIVYHFLNLTFSVTRPLFLIHLRSFLPLEIAKLSLRQIKKRARN